MLFSITDVEQKDNYYSNYGTDLMQHCTRHASNRTPLAKCFNSIEYIF